MSQTYVSSEKKLILARIGFFGDYEGRDFTIYLKYRAQLGVRFSENYTQSVTDRKTKRDILAKRNYVSRRFSHWLPSKSTLTKTNTVKLTKKIRL